MHYNLSVNIEIKLTTYCDYGYICYMNMGEDYHSHGAPHKI